LVCPFGGINAPQSSNAGSDTQIYVLTFSGDQFCSSQIAQFCSARRPLDRAGGEHGFSELAGIGQIHHFSGLAIATEQSEMLESVSAPIKGDWKVRYKVVRVTPICCQFPASCNETERLVGIDPFIVCVGRIKCAERIACDVLNKG